MVTVPSQYNQYVQAAAAGTGLPYQVVAAQVQAESNFNPDAVSPTGAEGFWQFEPGTYNDVASQAGVQPGSEFDVASETQAYIVLMNQLLQEEGGNVFQALEAYNAGPGNLQAGASYASGILQNAGEPSNLNTSDVTTTGIHLPNPLNILNPQGDITNAISSAFSAIENNFLKAIGVTSLKDLFERLGLILLGAVLIIVGLEMLTHVVSNTASAAKKYGKDAAETAVIA